MANENAFLNENQEFDEDMEDTLDFDELESKLESDLEEQLSDLEFLENEKEMISNPDNLGKVVMDVVWQQVINQIGEVAGEEFIKENHGLTLDLRDEAHIQTAENFVEGNIAKHNYLSKEQLEQNYDRYKNKPHKEFRKEYVNPGMDATLKRAGELKKEGIDTVTDIYTGRQIPTETKLENGKNNPKAAQREHVKSSAELYDNPSLQMANNNEELAAIINNPENLQGYTTAERNNRKSDKLADDMNEQDKNKHWEKANERAEEYIKQEEEKGEERLKQEGLKTQKEEKDRFKGTVKNASKNAIRTAVMGLLAELLKDIIQKLISWMKSKEKSLKTFIENLKEAIHVFVKNLKHSLMTAGLTFTNMVGTTIATAIIGPVVGTIKKIWMLLKQGVKSVNEAVQYLKNPENKSKPFSIKVAQVGKIIMAGLTGIGAIVLGEAIEKGLMTIPIFAVEIPLIGSLANIIGIFLGAVVSGIIGAIVINLIDKFIANRQREEAVKNQVKKGNDVLNTQRKLIAVKEMQLQKTKASVENSIVARHQEANAIIRGAANNILKSDDDENLNEINALLNNM